MKATISWLGQAGYLIEMNGCRVCVDPYLSNTVEAAEGLKRLAPPPIRPEELRVDYLVFTHDHLDHFDEPTVEKTRGMGITYVGPASCVKRLEKMKLGPVMGIAPGKALRLKGGISLRGTYARHTEDSVGFLFQEEDTETGGLYLTGDTEYDERLLEVGRYAPSTLIVCINGRLGNMDFRDAARLVAGLSVRMAIPCHYGMFAENTEDPKRFFDALKGSSVQYSELRLMESREFAL